MDHIKTSLGATSGAGGGMLSIMNLLDGWESRGLYKAFSSWLEQEKLPAKKMP